MNVCKFRTRSPLQKCKLCWIEPASILLGTNHWKYLIWLNRHSIWVKWPNLLVLIQVMVRRWEVRPCWLTGIPFNWLLSVSDGILKSILLPTFLMNLFWESSSSLILFFHDDIRLLSDNILRVGESHWVHRFVVEVCHILTHFC